MAVRHRPLSRHAAAGFTLYEVVLALLLMALVAALVMPTPNRPAGPTALRIAAYQVSALLRGARTAAISGGRPTSALVDGAARRVEAPGGRIELPPGITVGLAERPQTVIRFAPDGTSTGGDVRLATATARMTVAVNADTGAIQLAP